MPSRAVFASALLLPTLLSLAAPAQQPNQQTAGKPAQQPSPAAPAQSDAAAAFSKAAALYYTPARKGLRSIHCQIAFDWNNLFKRLSAQQNAAADEARIKYLNTVHLSFDDDLNGAGTLNWTSSDTPPDNSVAGIIQMRGGMTQMIQGFFQQWNRFQTGYMVSITDDKTKVERQGDGFHIYVEGNGALAEENFDKNLTLLSLHVRTPAAEQTVTPTFLDTPEGKVVKELVSSGSAGQGGTPSVLTTKITYAPVQGFQLPREIAMDVPSAGLFVFQVSACKVSVAAPAPPATPEAKPAKL